MHFHRRRILTAGAFTGAYALTLKYTTDVPNEFIRMGMAGSFANVVVEAGFHFADTVNVRAKVSDTHVSSLRMVETIYKSEGLLGFGRGFSACYYGSIACGFIYFSLYKLFKQLSREFLGDSYNIAWTYFLASFGAELFTLLVYYPYDLFKCRLQSKNYIFKYRNLPHAFRKEIS